MGIELIIPFIASVLVIIFLRRLDRSNYRLSQIKRFTHKLSEEINQVALNGVQAVKDANIDLEILNKQAKKLISEMNEKFSDTRLLVESIKANKEYLDSLSGDLNQVVKLTSEIRKESEYVQEGLHVLQAHREEIDRVESEIGKLRKDMSLMSQKYTDDINLKTRDLVDSLANKIVEIESLLESKSDRVDESLQIIATSYEDKLHENVDRLIEETIGKVEIVNDKMDTFFEQVRESERAMDGRINRFKDITESISDRVEKLDLQFEEKLEDVGQGFEEKLVQFDKKFRDKFEQIITQVNGSRESYMKGLQAEMDGIREEIQNMNLETLTRRDEILNETRRQAENIGESIIVFQEKYLEAENKLIKQADTKKSELIRDMEILEEEFKRISDILQTETEETRDSVKVSLKSFQTELEKVFHSSETSTKEKFFKIQTELEGSLKAFYDSEKVSVSQEISRLEDKVSILDKTTVERMKSVDDYFSDLKNALNESARDIMNQVETDVGKVARSLDEEKVRVDQKLNDFYQLKDKLEDSLQNLHNKKKSEFVVELGRIEEKIEKLNHNVVDKMQSVDEHFVDLKKALMESARDIIGQVEVDVSQLAASLDREKLKIDEKIDEMAGAWSIQLDKIKTRTNRDIDNLVERLKDIHLEGNELANTFRAEFQNVKNQMEIQLQKNLDHIASKGTNVVEDVQSRLKKTQLDAEDIMNRIQKAGLGLYEKQEGILSEYADRLSKDLKERLDKVRKEAEGTLQEIQKTGMGLIQKQEDRLLKFQNSVDERLYNEMFTKLSRVKDEAEQIYERIHKGGNEIIEKHSEKLSQFTLTLDEKLFKDLQFKLEKLRSESKELLSDIENKNKDVFEKFENSVGRLQDEIDEKLFRELKDRFEDVKADSEFLIEEVSRSGFELRQKHEDEIANFKTIVEEKLYKELILRFEKAKHDVESLVDNIHKSGNGIIEKHEEKINKLSGIIDDRFTKDIHSKLDKAREEGIQLLEGIKRAGEHIISEQETKFSRFTSTINEKFIQETEVRLGRLKKETEELLSELKESGDELLEKQEEKMQKFNSTLDERISRQLTVLLDKGQLQLDQLEMRIGSYIHDVKSNLEDTLNEAREDSERQLDNFNSLMQKNFREIEKMNSSFMEGHRDDYSRMKNEFDRTKEEFLKIRSTLDTDLERVKTIKQELFRELSQESNRMKRSVDTIAEKVHNLEGYTDIIDNTERVIQESDRKIEDMITLIERMKTEKEEVNIYLRNVEFIKTTKTNMEDEIKLLDSQKNKIEVLERELNKANEVCILINQRTDEIKDKIGILNMLDGKLQNIENIQKRLESKLNEAEAANDKIENLAITLAEHSENADYIREKVSMALKDLDMLRAREDELQETLEVLDAKTGDLNLRNVDIKSLESKFNKVENLVEDLAARHKQISSLHRRISELKSETEGIKEGLEHLITEADDRFDKLGNFLEVVDTVIETGSSASTRPVSRPRVNPKENGELMRRKRNTVLNLYENFGWNTDTIAEKLNLERSLVEAIINNSKKSASF